MKLALCISSFIAVLLLFIFKNTLYLILVSLWRFQVPTWKIVKDMNEVYVYENGKKIYYYSYIHEFFDYKPFKKPLYPRAYRLR